MSSDYRYKGQYVKMVRQAIMNFDILPLKYKSNIFDQAQVL